MIISKPQFCTHLTIWAPKYSSKYTDGERVALLAQYKVEHSSPVIIVEFTAKHLAGQRFCIKREDVQRCPLGSNGKIVCFEVPMSKFEGYDTGAEIRDIALSLFE